jgi:hypothetical protein
LLQRLVGQHVQHLCVHPGMQQWRLCGTKLVFVRCWLVRQLVQYSNLLFCLLQWSVHLPQHVHVQHRLDRLHLRHSHLRIHLPQWWRVHRPQHVHVCDGLDGFKVFNASVFIILPQRRNVYGPQHVLVRERLVGRHVRYPHVFTKL